MILDRFKLTDRVAIVTGAGKGVGAGIAVALAEVGADVVLAARTVDQLEATAEAVRATGRRALVVPTDVLERAQLEHLVAARSPSSGASTSSSTTPAAGRRNRRCARASGRSRRRSASTWPRRSS